MKDVPYGYCQCGCGQKTRVATINDRAKNQRKGRPLRYISGHNLQKGTKHPCYNGGLSYNKTRRRWIIYGRNGEIVPYARAVMEAHLKRELTSEEIVHHINGNPEDDRLENLQLFQGIAEHCAIGHYGYTRMHLLLKLRHYHNLTGKIPTREALEKTPWMPDGKTYYNRFGGFRKALKEADLL